MQEILNTAIWIISAVVLMTAIYHIVPFRKWVDKKPRFVFFPKYIAHFSGDTSKVISNIESMGFVLKDNSNNVFTRGKVYGDFSAKAMKLHVEINESEKCMKVYAPFMGVFFDTGDLWSIAYNAQNSVQP
ncbi:MAG: hypothetical protein GY828_06615 [Candidatus Gracilibacteria bacterium]|nr:hypothetical protein [Candidatus Gracilibacteria bacterium]